MDQTILNPIIDAVIDYAFRNRAWREYFQRYDLAPNAKKWYSNVLKFFLLTSILHTGVFLFFWDKVMVLISTSIYLMGMILILDPLWILTAPESHDNLRMVKNVLYKILDSMLAVISIAVEALRSLIKSMLAEDDKSKID
jgi:hypothetical protein